MAQEAGYILMKHYGRLSTIEYKGEIDLVTAADHESEEFLRSRIAAEFPDHIVIAEEGVEKNDLYNRLGRNTLKEEWIWIIDPLDGTTNFAHTFPMFSVSIGLAHKGEVVMGAVFNPYYKELFFAQQGEGATLNGAPIHVSSVNELDKALVVTGFPYDRREKVNKLLSYVRGFIRSSHGFRRCGSAALDFCNVAAGRTDGYWEEGLHPWDVAAGLLILREARGKVTNYEGREYLIPWWQTLATNGLIHDGMLEVLNNVTKELEI
jgi:myo-inositol-1(or 4)-monophosphatase